MDIVSQPQSPWREENRCGQQSLPSQLSPRFPCNAASFSVGRGLRSVTGAAYDSLLSWVVRRAGVADKTLRLLARDAAERALSLDAGGSKAEEPAHSPAESAQPWQCAVHSVSTARVSLSCELIHKLAVSWQQ